MRHPPAGPRYRIRRAICAAATFVALAALLAACSDARKAIGIDKSTPDEFKVVSRAPLSLPPDYSLRPPQPGAPRPQEGTIPDQARQAVVGTPARRAVTSAPLPETSGGESALLAQAGVARIQPGIRDIVNQEASVLAEADRTFVDRLIFWRKPEEPGVVIDPQREAQRLRENQALGRPVNEGDTPIIRRRQKGALEGIF